MCQTAQREVLGKIALDDENRSQGGWGMSTRTAGGSMKNDVDQMELELYKTRPYTPPN